MRRKKIADPKFSVGEMVLYEGESLLIVKVHPYNAVSQCYSYDVLRRGQVWGGILESTLTYSNHVSYQRAQRKYWYDEV